MDTSTAGHKIYNGKLSTHGYTGILIAFDVWTGHILWTLVSSNHGVGRNSLQLHSTLSLASIADEKMYLYSSEHSPNSPKDAMQKYIA